MSLANLARDVGRKAEADSTSKGVVNIITFIEATWGLGMRLFPVQKIILKAHYGLALDTNPEGFDLTKPVPLDYPNYEDFIDTRARPATNKVEILELSEIPDDAFIELTDHLGGRTRLVNGEHWFVGADEMETVQSIEDAINSILGVQFVAEAFYGACQVHITSKGFSVEGNNAHLEVTACEGMQIAVPELEIDEYGWEPHIHRFYGGTGGFYKHRVAITDWRRENAKVFTEAEYLQYLYDDGRSNIATVIPGKERREMILSIGRRSGKTTISACIAAYETYKLIKKGDPQEFYGLPDSNVIQIISVATDKDQAGLLYRDVYGHFTNCDYFGTYMANATQTFATFQTPNDIDRFGTMKENPKARFSVKVTFRSCVAKGLRGAGNIVVILDEVAHFTDKGQSGAKEVYDAVTPSTSAFSKKDPEDTRRPIGPVEGRIILISSPLGRQGQFFRLFQIGMRGGKASMNMLCIEAPTWEVNPTIPTSEFEKHYAKDPRVFFTEYGGQFTDRTSGWIEEKKDLLACINPEQRPQKKARPRMPHFLGLDVGLVGDGTAAAIGHLDDRGNVIVDLVTQIKAGEGDYEGQERLEFDDVADWVYGLSRKFYLTGGMFDTWAGIPMEQALAKRGLKQMESVHHTKSLKSQIYQNLKDMMFDKRLELYDYPIPEDAGKEHCPYIQELLELQAEVQSKYIIIVEAPDMDGKHDDMSDALARMVWLATNHVGKAVSFGKSSKNSKNSNLGARLSSPTQSAKARMKARMGGTHPSRMAGLSRNRGGGTGGTGGASGGGFNRGGGGRR